MIENRVYFCIDMKSFFASVECAERGLDPFSTNLVVADASRSDKTICLAVSPAMKKLGVRNRCRLFEVPKNLKFIIAPPRMKKYIEYASEIYSIYLQHIDKNDIHVYSIDECFIDATDYLKLYNLRAKDFAKQLMGEIDQKLHIPSTAGIGSNLYLAKIALDITAKHSADRIGWLTEEKFVKTLSHHQPLSDFWGISRGTIERLKKFGIVDMADISECDERVLFDEFGVNAELLIDHSRGVETCTMADIKAHRSKSKSHSSSQILPCNYNFSDAKLVLQEMVQSGCYDLARSGYVTDLIHIFVGYGDNREAAKATMRMHEVTNLFSVIGACTSRLFDEKIDRNRPIRRVGFDFGNLQNEDAETYDFFTDLKEVEKEKKLVSSILQLQDKFGKNAVFKADDLQKNATLLERNLMIGGHKSGDEE